MSALACAERVEVCHTAEGPWLGGARVSGAALLSLQGALASGGGIYGVLYDDGRSEMVRTNVVSLLYPVTIVTS